MKTAVIVVAVMNGVRCQPKIPHFIHKRDDEPMAFAGLWGKL